MTKDHFKIAIRNLKSRSLRSWLTIFGIVIGIFLIMSLLSLSEGIKAAIMQELRMMGSDVLMVYPGELSDIVTTMVGGAELSDEDLAAIDRAEGVEEVIPFVYRSVVMRYEGEKKPVLLYGVPLEALEVLMAQMGWQVQEGRFPLPGKREVFVGSFVPEEIFPQMRLGSPASLAGKQFEVVGVMRSLGNKMDDSMVGIDESFFREITGKREGAPLALVTIEPGLLQEEVAENIKEELNEVRKRKRGEDLLPFSVITSEKATGMVSNVMNIVQLAIFAIAGIAIVVGAIGIMNTMYTAVRERTKEIGIMKAVGAKTSDISMIFLIEAGTMGLMGGAGGTFLGVGGAKMVELFLQFHPVFYLTAFISPAFIIFGLLFAFLVGCLSGWLPARRAARLKPVDALRYE